MKLLTSSALCDRFYEKVELLRSNGIAIYLSDEGMSNIKPGIPISMWVIINSQYDDAINLLDNPKYFVKNPISQVEMKELENFAKMEFQRSKNRIAITAFSLIVIVVAIFFGLFFLIKK